MDIATIIILLMAYLLGSIPFAMVASKLFDLPDPRTYGSKNPGATNVLRSGKIAAAVVTLLGDAGKGWLAVELTRAYVSMEGGGYELISGAALLVFLGHLFPIFLNFKGGKGVATAAGVLLGFNVLLGSLVILTWIIVAAISRLSSLSALTAAVLAPIYSYLIFNWDTPVWAVIIISLLLMLRHQANIINLIEGKETRIGKKATDKT